MIMSPSTTSTTTAATATVVDSDTNSVVDANQIEFQADTGPKKILPPMISHGSVTNIQ